ncbi:hypothetical protein Sjap_024515 [Stephania japonica]|uniref:Uncharacterized protein n=1 Tax=Stephania japonica TaxID=461633 RepID=A0AAP0EIW3_9MAGN
MFIFCALYHFAATMTPQPRRHKRAIMAVDLPFWGLDIRPSAIEGLFPNPNPGNGFLGNMNSGYSEFVNRNFRGKKLTVIGIAVIINALLITDIAVNYSDILF